MARQPLVAANWKMNLLRSEAASFCDRLLSQPPTAAEVAIFPPAPLLDTVERHLTGSAVRWGGQDLHPEDAGAHTGDTSARHLVDLGCHWALCGHSERRQDHGEDDALVAAKAAAAVRHGLEPMLCLGETREERRAGRTMEVLRRQLLSALPHLGKRFALAYEPVWAIGTGETATPELAQEAHAFLRSLLAESLAEEAAQATRILYGGSAKPANAASLIAQPDLDGFLVGGASLDPQPFLAIIGACA
ncbi:MAG: triose-phosphate isomerase [Acidobacteriota bacterium]